MFTGIFIAVAVFVAILFVILLVIETRNCKETELIAGRLSELAVAQSKLRKDLDNVKNDLKEAEKDREARKEQEERFYTGVNNILNYNMETAFRKATGDANAEKE